MSEPISPEETLSTVSTIVLHGLKDRSEADFRIKFSQFGPLQFVKVISPANCVIISFQAPEGAKTALSECKDEEIFLADVRRTLVVGSETLRRSFFSTRAKATLTKLFGACFPHNVAIYCVYDIGLVIDHFLFASA
jgi:hypothetical protein